jgi:hypothetical protein
MRFQTMTPPSAMLIALCTLLLSGCGESTTSGDIGPGSRNHEEELGDSAEMDAPREGEEGVTLCHIPPGNPANAHTLTVGAPAVKAHLRHGDHLGAWEGTSEPDAGTPPTDGGNTPPELDAGTPGPVDGGQTCAGHNQVCGGELPCCSGLTCRAGVCSPIIN